MHLPVAPTRALAPLGVALALVACDQVVVDDWGPPAGYASIDGRVTRASGAPVASAEVAFARCDAPLGGFLGAAATGSDGGYHLEGALPPRGAFPSSMNADTLRVRCRVIVNRDGVARDSIDVQFRRERPAAPLQALDVVLP